mmetsp:Transcript_36485/g.88423  ORF Transcript_36485/g.88423 Transcript_36485/m.88423 type:complete len:387 (-) Transcript_36485:151-1311(-)
MAMNHYFSCILRGNISNDAIADHCIMPVSNLVVATIETRDKLIGVDVLMIWVVVNCQGPFHNCSDVGGMKNLVGGKWKIIDRVSKHLSCAATTWTSSDSSQISQVLWVVWSPLLQRFGIDCWIRCRDDGGHSATESKDIVSLGWFWATDHNVGSTTRDNGSKSNGPWKVSNVYTVLGQQLHFATVDPHIQTAFKEIVPNDSKSHPLSSSCRNDGIDLAIDHDKFPWKTVGHTKEWIIGRASDRCKLPNIHVMSDENDFGSIFHLLRQTSRLVFHDNGRQCSTTNLEGGTAVAMWMHPESSWHVIVRQGGAVIVEFAGLYKVCRVITWQLSTYMESVKVQVGFVSCRILIMDISRALRLEIILKVDLQGVSWLDSKRGSRKASIEQS